MDGRLRRSELALPDPERTNAAAPADDADGKLSIHEVALERISVARHLDPADPAGRTSYVFARNAR
jgi:hypothetical protein